MYDFSEKTQVQNSREDNAEEITSSKVFPNDPVRQAVLVLDAHHSTAALHGNGLMPITCFRARSDSAPPSRIDRWKIGQDEQAPFLAIAASQSSKRPQTPYFTTSIINSSVTTGRGKAEEVEAETGIVLDDDIGKRVKRHPEGFPPTFIWQTNAEANRQQDWALTKPVPPEQHERINALMARKCGGDPEAVGKTRIWKLPGTLAYPTAKKIAAGRSPQPFRVVLTGGSGLKVDPDALERALEGMDDLPEATAAASKLNGSHALVSAPGGGSSQPITDLTWEQFAEAARMIPNDGGAPIQLQDGVFDLNERGAWCNVGFAIHHQAAFAGKLDEGSELFDELSQRHPSYDADATENFWASIHGKSGAEINGRLILKLAGACGWENPIKRPVTGDDFEAIEDDDDDVAEGDDDAAEGDDEEKIFKALNAALKAMNRKHALVMIDGQAVVVNFDPRKPGKYTYSKTNDLKIWYTNDKVSLPPKEKGKEPEKVNKAVFWLSHPKRRQYPGIEFNPKTTTPGHFNLYKGPAYEPKEDGHCDLVFDYFANVVCSGDTALYTWLMAWMAHMVQKPWEKPGVAVALRGIKGIGKSFLGERVLGPLFPHNTVVLSDPNDLLGNFNAHLQAALLCLAEETFWAGDKRAESKFKSLVTAPRIGIEPKFVNKFHVDNYSRFLLTSNEDWVVPATLDERRFVMVDVSERRRGDRAYFGAIVAQLEAGGYSRLLWELQHVDLSKTDPCTAHRTAALFDQMVQGFEPVQRFIWEWLKSGSLPGEDFEPLEWAARGVAVPVPILFDAFEVYERKFKRTYPLSIEAFGAALRKMLPGVDRKKMTVERGKRKWHYAFPPLPECRDRFAKSVGLVIDWDRYD